MGSLIRQIRSSGAAKIGVNLLDQAPPPSPVASVSRVVGIVGHFPWGPQNTVTTCGSFAEFLANFYPPAFGAPDVSTYPAMKALLAPLPYPLKVVNINPTSSADVATVLSYTVSGGAWLGTANYPGTLGNLITLTWAAATDADSAHRNLTVAIGSTYSKLYENVTTTSILTLGDPYITFTASSTPSALPAAAASVSSTTAGSNGTAQASDYVGSVSSNVGIRKFYAANVNVDVLFVAECPSGSVNTVNTGLVAYGSDAGKSTIAILSSVASQSYTSAITYVSSYTDTGSKTVYVWPRVKLANVYDAELDTITADGNAWMAALCTNVDPWLSPEGKTSVPHLTAITDLETNDSADGVADLLVAAGVSPFFLEDTLGTILAAAVVTNTTSGQTLVLRSRYRDHISRALAAIAIQYQGLPLDVDLAGSDLGPTSGACYAAMTELLAEELRKRHIAGFSVDPFGANTQADIDAGNWTVAIAVDLYAPTRKLIISTTIGPTVSVATS